MKTVGVKYICPSGNSGYAEAAKDYIIGLHKKGIPITVSLMKMDKSDSCVGERNKIVNSLVNKKVDYNKVIIHSTPEFWKKVYLEEKSKNPEVEIIGMTVWETDKIDDRWIDWINEIDRVVVPCTHNKKVFENCNIFKPIGIIPHISKSIEINLDFDNIVSKNFLIKLNKAVNGDDFVFYTIGQWSNRKGIEETIVCYLKTFSDKPFKTNLIVKTFKNDYSVKEKEKIRNRVNSLMDKFKNPAKIILILDECTDEEINIIHNIGNCYISLCKSEGWGLGAFDAAGLKKPVIMTGYGGQVDFLESSLLVNYKLIPVEGMNWIPWYNNTQKWANPDVNHAQKLLLKVREWFLKKDPSFSLKLQSQSFNVLTNYSYEAISQKLIDFLDN
jgi:hypothetical protein